MGWDMLDASRPKMYSYDLRSKEYIYGKDGLYFWNWSAWSIWRKEEAAIRYINDADQPITFKKMSMRILACNSGGQGYWAHNGWIKPPGTNGHGATYTIKTFVCNTPGAKDLPCSSWTSLQFEQGTPAVNHLDPDSFNMNYPGTSTANCGQFGNPPYDFPMREFPLENVTDVLPGGFILFQLGATNRDGGESRWDPTIRFSMNPLEMEVEIEPKFNPYVWRAYHENGKVVWHLVRPVQVKATDGWHNIEGDDEN